MRDALVMMAAISCVGHLAQGQSPQPTESPSTQASANERADATYLEQQSEFERKIVEAAKGGLPALVALIKPSVFTVGTFAGDGASLMQGTAFLYDDSFIVTNVHVVDAAHRATVVAEDGTSYDVGQLVGYDDDNDVVALSTAGPLPATLLRLQPAAKIPLVGESIFVVGSPQGLQGTVTSGVVSAIRDIGEFKQVIQISAPMSPGSSGSPVVDSSGHVVGVACFLLVEGQNLNFAIPIDRIPRRPDYGKSIQFLRWWANKPSTLADWNIGRANVHVSAIDDLLVDRLRAGPANDGDRIRSEIDRLARLAVLADPNNGRAWSRQAMALLERAVLAGADERDEFERQGREAAHRATALEAGIPDGWMARYLFGLMARDDAERRLGLSALRTFEKVAQDRVSTSPNDAGAWAELAQARLNMAECTDSKDEEEAAVSASLSATDRAIELDPLYTEAFRTRIFIATRRSSAPLSADAGVIAALLDYDTAKTKQMERLQLWVKESLDKELHQPSQQSGQDSTPQPK